MPTKAEITSRFIVETVAPVFNKMGYIGTSMSDITKATGLTKGAIYGNFDNKEHLALEALNYNIRKVMWKLADEINEVDNAEQKLRVMTAFYRKYYNYTIEFGGCPLLNIGIDTNNTNSILHDRVVDVLHKLQKNTAGIIQLGIDQGLFKPGLNTMQISARIISLIQGAIFTSVMLKEPAHILDMMDHLDLMIDNEIRCRFFLNNNIPIGIKIIIMKFYLFLVRIYIKVLSFLSTEKAANFAFQLFQKVRKIKFKKRESLYYNNAHEFTANSVTGPINCYETGDPNGELVFLVHGWESNAGSMGGMANVLVKRGYHVISMDLPAHGNNKRTHTNLYECKEALKSVIERVWPSKPFSIVAHSFGSAVTTFALSESNYNIDKLVFLTSPDELSAIFDQFKSIIELPDEPYQLIVNKAQDIFGEELKTLSVKEKAKQIDYNTITLIHDEYDKMLPYSNSQDICTALDNSNLITLKKSGHYRMLWNDEVYALVDNQFNLTGETKKSGSTKELKLAI